MQILAMNKRLTGRDSKLFQINTFNQLHDPPSVLLISHLHTDKRQLEPKVPSLSPSRKVREKQRGFWKLVGK